MKNIRILGKTLAGSIIGILSMLVITACTEPTMLERPPSTPQTQWEKQLQHAQSLNGYQQLELKQYRYIGKVESEAQKKQLIEDLFADDTYTVAFYSPDCSIFEFKTWGDLKETKEDIGNLLKSQVEESIVIRDTEIIELEWNYKGNTFLSTALSSEKSGIFYDNIASYISDPTVDKNSKQKKVYGTITRQGEYYRVPFTLSDREYNWLGGVKWEYEIKCTTLFDRNGIFYDTEDMRASHQSSLGWCVDAKIQTVAGVIGQTDYHRFAWAWVADNKATPIISGGSFGFSISGSGRGETGEETHRCPPRPPTPNQ